MQAVRIGIIGASGYSGIELTRLVLRHRSARLVFATSDRWVGQAVAKRLGLASELSYVGVEAGLELVKAGQVDAVFLATPAESSLELVPRLRGLAATVKLVDLSGAFRLGDLTQYPPFYRFEHTAPELVKQAVYGLPELFRDDIRRATVISNPGCYATAATLSVAPLLRAGLIDPDSVVINAASGVSGAGRKASEDYSFMEIDADFRAYRTLAHQHLPELRQTLARVAGTPVPLVFTPHLLPLKRGILNTTVARLKPNVSAVNVVAAFTVAFGTEPLISLVANADAVRIADVVNTPRTIIGASVDATHVVVVSALDNLLKGAASQAMQNLNLMVGLSETEGLL